MTQEEKYKITSNDYVDLMIDYNENLSILEGYQDASTQVMNIRYAVIYVPFEQVRGRGVGVYGYLAIPKCYGLVSARSLEASGISNLRNVEALNLRGEGVLVGIIDTGIDYTNPVFLRDDGTSRIVSIWDQTIDSEDKYPADTFYGTEYTEQDINLALQSDNPYVIVPSRDEIGHGTMLAGVAAGSEMKENDFSGVVPDAELAVVKLKQAKQIYRDYFIIPPDVPCYQENDIMWGIRYLTRVARRVGRPLAICIGLGTTQGSHTGLGYLADVVSVTGQFPGVAISTAVGNEGMARRHFYGEIDPSIGYNTIELNVGENELGFTMEIWGKMPGIYSLDILSPQGEYIPRIVESLKITRLISFIFEATTINVDYQMVERRSGNQLMLLRFHNPSQGIWKIKVYGRGDLKQSFHSWLPLTNFISKDTYFVQSDPFTTITSPGDARIPISTTAYDPNNDTLYQNSGRGFTVLNAVSPTLAAPGVDILSPNLEHGFDRVTGTSVATAHMTGITAMLLEWGIVKGNYPGIESTDIKKFLIRGAKRSPRIHYPDKNWGYGIVDIYNVFNVLRSEG